MEQTGISQAFVDFMQVSEIEESKKSGFLSFIPLVQRQILV